MDADATTHGPGRSTGGSFGNTSGRALWANWQPLKTLRDALSARLHEKPIVRRAVLSTRLKGRWLAYTRRSTGYVGRPSLLEAATGTTGAIGGANVAETESRQTDAGLSRDEVLRRAEKGDRSVLPLLNDMLDRAPDVVAEIGDLAWSTNQALLALTAGENLWLRECQERTIKAMRENLAGPNPSPLEELLAERISQCWHHLNYLECRRAQIREVTFTEGEYWQRCIDRAHRRFLSATKALAQVRKLGITLQVNVASQGGKQVNVSTYPSPSEL